MKIGIAAIMLSLLSGCASYYEFDLRQLAKSTSYADLQLERGLPVDKQLYYSFNQESQLDDMGEEAIPVGERLLRDIDHRLRCSGLSILLRAKGPEAMKPVWVEYLNDPYYPIRYTCQFYLSREFEFARLPDDAPMGEWNALKADLEKRLKSSKLSTTE